MSTYPEDFKNALTNQVRVRLFEEGVPRIKKCLAQLSAEEIWHRPNDNLVSIGNLVLHLCGNVRQWIVAGLGGKKDTRVRQVEFDTTVPISTEKLLADLGKVMEEVEEVLNEVSPEELLKSRKVQGIFEETGVSILVHVVEHFSYHVGQITRDTKMIRNMDIGYYSNMNLDG